jgi:hypothetical protein
VTKESTIDMNRVRCLLAILLAGALALGTPQVLAAAELSGQVVFTNLAIPGVTVTATRGEELVTTSTDPMGVFQFPSLDEGTWTVEVRMVGFAPITREIAVGPDTTPSTWELTLLSFEEITRDLPDPAAAPTQVDEPTGDGSGGARIATSTGVPDSTAGGFQRAGVASAPAVAQAAPADAEPVDASQAADGFLVNGSVNNGASTPFALQAAFGNNRISRGGRYSGTAGVLGSSSAWDARPYSLTGLQTARPDYHNVHYQLTFGGPLPLPGVRQPLQFFVGYQRTTNDTSSTQPALVPTALERAGDFSGSRTALGQPVQVVDPETGQPFPGGVIPAERISPQARALLGYYPDPAIANAGNRFNFEAPLLGGQTRDAVQVRLTKTVAGNPFQGTINWDRSVGDSTTLFGFDSENRSSGVQTGLTWNRRVGFRNNLRGSYQFSRQTSRSVPYFANRVNVSGEAGIAGNNQDPVNWGPPSLVFSSGLAGLSDTQPQRSRTTTQGGGLELFMNRGRHNVTYGGNLRRHDVDLLSQPNPRGTFTFSGTATGSDFADFLLGLPSASAISYGVAETNLRGFSYDAYVTDDWRVGPGLTLTLGVRWEYESPYSEEAGHLVNLDVAPDFSAVAPVLATDALGALTGRRYAGSLVDGDWGGVQPRLALAWRPLPGSSLVVRAGYGIYRNTGVYQTIARQMTQQSPLSTTLSVASTPENPLTLANGFTAPPTLTPHTFSVDPDFRVGSSHNWQVSAQRDLPMSLTVNVSYLGTRGTGLVRQFLPNTYPAGVASPCPTCPSGFVYVTSGGSSSRHAAQIQVRRRLRGGFTSTVQYTLARAMDDAASFSSATLSGTAFAQDWRDLDAEYGPSSFDRRHEMSVTFQYTTGVGVGGGALIDGWRGTLLKGWTFAGTINAGSGLPLTPYVLTPAAGTGFSGSVRAALTGEPTGAPNGYYLNPAAYTVPAAGQWGDAGRNSGRGPGQLTLDGSLTRSFQVGSRSLDFLLTATNLLNRVTLTCVITLVGCPQCGLPTAATQMRRLQMSLRTTF